MKEDGLDDDGCTKQRVEFVGGGAEGEGLQSSLRRVPISRPTGYLWCKRYGSAGLEGIAEQSRKPHKSPSKTAECVEQQVVALWQRYPDWGARKLALRLVEQAGPELPASTVHRILRRHKLVEQREQRSRECKRFERSRPNELWQMDFKGPAAGISRWATVILDDHSRYLIGLQALGSTQAEPVREQLEQVFERCGVPEGMLMDHASRGGVHDRRLV